MSNADSATCLGGITFNQGYTYDTIGNLTNKAGVAYTYPANGGVRPHAVSTVGGAAYTYDNNGNLLTGGGRTYTWNAENQPTQIVKDYITESYVYDGDNTRIKKTTVDNSTRTPIVSTTVYVGGLVEYTGNKTISSYGGIAVRTVVGTYSVSNPGELVFLHSDHLGSVSATSNAAGTVAQTQNFDPWGAVRSGGITSTEFNYTGQRKDAGTGLLFYNARYYDPVLARFTQADSIVPGTSHRALTVDFHENGFRSAMGGENNQGFWFQMSDKQRQKATAPWGPGAPQELNRYSYVNNNPLKYTDPSGHKGVVDSYTMTNTNVDGSQANRAILQTLITKLTIFLNNLGAGIDLTESYGTGGLLEAINITWGTAEETDKARKKLGDDVWSFLQALLTDMSKLLDGTSAYDTLTLYMYQNWATPIDHWTKMKYTGTNSSGTVDVDETDWYYDYLGTNDRSEYIEDVFARLDGTVYRP